MLLLLPLFLCNCQRSLPETLEMGANVGYILNGVVFSWPLNYNYLPKQPQLNNETVEGGVSFCTRKTLLKWR